MSKLNYFAASGAALMLATTFSTTALAWHPQGKITKEVQNVTLSSAYADANDANTAIAARPGDVLRYRMTVVNPAPAADKQWNDLTKIKVTDTLPSGVTMDSGSKDADFKSTVVVPQSSKNGTKSVSYVFTVKVNAGVADKTVICNTATFNGNSIVGDAPRSGSDKACVKVTVPPAPKQIKVCDLATKQIITINENQFNSLKHSKNLDDCCINEPPKQIEVCDLNTKKIITIDENKFDRSKHSKNLDDCKVVPPKMIDVCELATKKVVSIDEKNFDAAKYSKDLDKCKEVVQPKTIEVCELATKKVVKITEDKFDASKYSKNLDDCGQILSTTTTTPPAVLPAVLPSTGAKTPSNGLNALMVTALSGITYATVAFIQRRHS